MYDSYRLAEGSGWDLSLLSRLRLSSRLKYRSEELHQNGDFSRIQIKDTSRDLYT